jgi:uncharacterized protein (DUF58 family)
MDIGRLRQSSHRVAFRFLRPGSVPTPGVHRSVFRGHGLNFAGYREYQYGDDIRLVDWNVTARHNRPVVKIFEQEHASALVLVLDASASMRVPHPDKWRAAAELAVLFAFVAARDSERVGVIVASDRVEAEVAPRRGFAHATRLAQWLKAFQPAGDGTGIEAGVLRAERSLRSPAAIIVASDFLSPRWDAAIREAVRRHTVVGLAISSPFEHDVPDVGLVRVRDAERDETRWVDTRSAAVRRALAERSAAIRRTIRSRLVDAGAIHVGLRTDRPPLAELASICRVRGAA